MGSSQARPVPPLKPVPAGKVRICIAGYTISSYTGFARRLAGLVTQTHGDAYETWMYFDAQSPYYAFLKEKFDPIPFPPHLKGHSTSPFVWLERGPSNDIELLGGATEFKQWILKQLDLVGSDQVLKEAAEGSWKVSDIFHDKATSAQPTADVSEPNKAP